jgi:hypothetical protein
MGGRMMSREVVDSTGADSAGRDGNRGRGLWK